MPGTVPALNRLIMREHHNLYIRQNLVGWRIWLYQTWLVLGLFLGIARAGYSLEVVSEPKRLFGLGDLQSVAISADQRVMATAGQAGAFLWDLQTGALVRPLNSVWAVTSLAFSPDSQTLLGASAGTVESWSTQTGESLLSFPGSIGDIFSLQVAARGDTFVSVAGDGLARIWSMKSGELVHTIQKTDVRFFAAALSPDARRLATLDPALTNNVTLWDVANEAEIGWLPKTNWTAERILFTSDGHLVTAAAGLEVLLWDVESARVIQSFAGVGAPTLQLHDLWMLDDTTLAALGNDGRIFRWNIRTGTPMPILPGDPVLAGAGVPGAALVVTAGADSVPRLRELASGNVLRSYPGHTTSTHAGVAFSPDGQYVLSGGTEPATRLWNRRTGQMVREFVGSGVGTMSAAFSPDGTKVLTTVGLPNPGARLWRTETGELVRDLRWSGSWPMSAAFSKDGKRIAAGAQDSRVRIFDEATGGLVRTLVGSGWMRTVAFSPKAPLLACGSSDGNARIFNHENGQQSQTFFAEAGPVVRVAFSPDGKTLLVAWGDGLARLFDVPSFKQREEFFTRAAFLESAAYSPDGQFILTGEGWPAFTSTLWDAQTVQPLRVFADHRSAVGAVGFSADGASILTAGERVREWSISDLAARIQLQPAAGGWELRWSLGRLQQAIAPEGPWRSLPAAASPFAVRADGPAGFYRVELDSEE